MKEKVSKKQYKFEHVPVMPKESIEFLNIKRGGIYVDGTLGGGGHTAIIANILDGSGRIIGIDQDPDALKAAKSRLAQYKTPIEFVYDNFVNFCGILDKLGIEKVDGILFDLGVSTYQIENPKRGFSFNESDKNLNSKLDMRMNPLQHLTAFNIVNKYREDQLRNILFKLGEEPYSRNIARKIIQRRVKNPIITTNDLLEVIKSATPPKYRFSRKHGHYASKVFRGIRMEVNQELVVLQEVIPQAVVKLKSGGRLVIISFHSGEDRIVKRKFRDMASVKSDKKPLVKLLTKNHLLQAKKRLKIIQNQIVLNCAQ